MPARSKKQAKLFGLALQYKRGKISDDKVSDKVKELADSMTEDQLKKYAETNREELPAKVGETMDQVDESELDENYATAGGGPGMGPVTMPGSPGHMSSFGSQTPGSGDPQYAYKSKKKRPKRTLDISFEEFRDDMFRRMKR